MNATFESSAHCDLHHVEEHCCFVFLLLYMLKVSVPSQCNSARKKRLSQYAFIIPV